MDLMLDLIVLPDSSYHVKDEDEFDAMLQHGLIDQDVARSVRKELASVIERVENNVPPFCEPWPDWRPDPTWEIPALPGDWRDL